MATDLGPFYAYVRFAEADAAKILPGLIRALKDRDVAVRLEAAKLLMHMGPAARPAMPALLEALKDTGYIPPRPTGLQSQYSMSLYAAHGLLAIGPEGEKRLAREGVPMLMEQLKHKDSRVRYYAALALEALGDRAKAAVPVLMQDILDDIQWQKETSQKKYRASFYHDLLQSTGAAAVPELTKWLQGDDLELRKEALRILERMGRPARSAVPALISALGDKDSDNRRAAASALGKIGRVAADAAEALTKAGADEDVQVAYAAALALKNVDPTSAAPVRIMARLLGEGKFQHSQKLSLLRDLAKWGRKSRAAAPALAACLGWQIDEDHSYLRELQHEAARTLAIIEPEEKDTAVKALLAMIDAGDNKAALILAEMDPDNKKLLPALLDALKKATERRESWDLDALGLIGARGQPVLPLLLDYLKGRGGYIALSALSKMGPAAKGALPALLDALEAWDDSRENLVDTLIKIGPEAREVHSALLNLLNDADDPDCALATVALGKIGPSARAAVPRLSKLLENKRLRLEAAEALIDITEKESPYLEVVLKVLADSREDQVAAAGIVERLGSRAKAAVPALRKILKEADDPGLLAAALQALAAIGADAHAAQRDVIPFLQSRHHHVRSGAVRALGEFGGDNVIPTLVVFIEEETNASLAEEGEQALAKVRMRQKRR